MAYRCIVGSAWWRQDPQEWGPPCQRPTTLPPPPPTAPPSSSPPPSRGAPQIGVLHWFARLWEIEVEEMWGYVTNCGTEGNLHGILVGRENLPDGVLYSSKESHYSVFKAARMYRMDAVKVDTLESGEIDYEHLRSCLAANAHRPAILNVNIGTTVRGAVDDVDKVIAILGETGYTEDRFFIHCDGALFGMMVRGDTSPAAGWAAGRGCCRRAWELGGGLGVLGGGTAGLYPGKGRRPAGGARRLPRPLLYRRPPPQIPFVKRAPMVTFQKPIGSVSVSGHKFVGAPVPCGVVMTRLKYIRGVSSGEPARGGCCRGESMRAPPFTSLAVPAASEFSANNQ